MELISRMKNGERLAINEGLNHIGAWIRANGIVFAVKTGYSLPHVISKLKELKEDETPLFGAVDSYTVADFAKAALDIFNVESYKGDKKTIKNLIECKMDF